MRNLTLRSVLGFPDNGAPGHGTQTHHGCAIGRRITSMRGAPTAAPSRRREPAAGSRHLAPGHGHPSRRMRGRASQARAASRDVAGRPGAGGRRGALAHRPARGGRTTFRCPAAAARRTPLRCRLRRQRVYRRGLDRCAMGLIRLRVYIYIVTQRGQQLGLDRTPCGSAAAPAFKKPPPHQSRHGRGGISKYLFARPAPLQRLLPALRRRH